MFWSSQEETAALILNMVAKLAIPAKVSFYSNDFDSCPVKLSQKNIVKWK